MEAESACSRGGLCGREDETDVAAESGLALATVYATIAGKEELLRAIHASADGRCSSARERPASGARSAFEAILKGVETYVGFLAEHRDYLRVHLNEAQPWALDPKSYCNEQKRQWSGPRLSTAVFAGPSRKLMIVGDPACTRAHDRRESGVPGGWVEAGMKEHSERARGAMQDHVRRSYAAT